MKSYFARAWATTFSGVLEGWKNNRRKDRSGIRKGFILLGVARIIASFIVASLLSGVGIGVEISELKSQA